MHNAQIEWTKKEEKNKQEKKAWKSCRRKAASRVEPESIETHRWPLFIPNNENNRSVYLIRHPKQLATVCFSSCFHAVCAWCHTSIAGDLRPGSRSKWTAKRAQRQRKNDETTRTISKVIVKLFLFYCVLSIVCQMQTVRAYHAHTLKMQYRTIGPERVFARARMHSLSSMLQRR